MSLVAQAGTSHGATQRSECQIRRVVAQEGIRTF